MLTKDQLTQSFCTSASPPPLPDQLASTRRKSQEQLAEAEEKIIAEHRRHIIRHRLLIIDHQEAIEESYRAAAAEKENIARLEDEKAEAGRKLKEAPLKIKALSRIASIPERLLGGLVKGAKYAAEGATIPFEPISGPHKGASDDSLGILMLITFPLMPIIAFAGVAIVTALALATVAGVVLCAAGGAVAGMIKGFCSTHSKAEERVARKLTPAGEETYVEASRRREKIAKEIVNAGMAAQQNESRRAAERGVCEFGIKVGEQIIADEIGAQDRKLEYLRTFGHLSGLQRFPGFGRRAP